VGAGAVSLGDGSDQGVDTAPAAPPVRPLAPGDLPLAILVDYDGTIAQTDVSDTVMAEFVTGDWEREAAAYDAGLMGSRRLMTLEMAMVDADPADLLATAAEQPHDPGFVPFVRRAQAAGIPVEVVSDGFGFFIEPALRALGVGEVPVITARTTFEGRRASIDYPNGHPTCFVCGTCKRQRVMDHQAAGRAVVFIGDGESDRYAAGYSDIVFAKRALVRICVEAGWPFQRWTEFSEIEAWLAETVDAWRADPSSLPRPGLHPFFCGPEVWGPGLEDPPAGAWPPAGAESPTGAEPPTGA
jgi:2-hydroxy-3-keto-5-methylthiopentenyl-1-phosphate phosphatase